MRLDRFIIAQENDYQQALKEIRNGHKRSHWIWYIFPQIKGLGRSYNAEYYGITNLSEARDYLQNPTLREHLLEITQAFYDLDGNDPVKVLGGIDAKKVKSCMTLFYKADPKITLFKDVLDKYYGGQLDFNTLEKISLKIAVFCGSTHGTDPEFVKQAKALGAWIGDHHHVLIYGGGHAGSMGDVSLSCLDHGGQCISIAPLFLKREEDPRVARHIDVVDLSARKKAIIEMADAFVALPGGPGTLEEISDVISQVRLRRISKPYCFFNIDRYYDPLITMYDEMVEKGFFTKVHRKQILFASTLDEVIKIIES